MTSVYGDKRKQVIPELSRRFPFRGNDEYMFCAELPRNDTRLDEIREYLKSHNVKLMPFEGDRVLEKSPDGYFCEFRFHAYDDSDYANAEYLWLSGMDGGEWDANSDGGRGTDGMLLMIAESLKPRARLMSEGQDLFIVSALGRKEMEEEGFVGLGFHPTKQCKEKFVKGELVWVPHNPAPERAVWELRPTIELPPMHSEAARTFDGNPVPPGYQGPVAFKNEGFDDIQLVYARSAISRVAPFDIAHAWEWRVGDGYKDPAFPIIVSQRFYKYCKAKKIPAKFIPVKIVEGE